MFIVTIVHDRGPEKWGTGAQKQVQGTGTGLAWCTYQAFSTENDSLLVEEGFHRLGPKFGVPKMRKRCG